MDIRLNLVIVYLIVAINKHPVKVEQHMSKDKSLIIFRATHKKYNNKVLD